MNVGQAYLDIYQFPTTTFRGFWGPVIVLFVYYWFLTCCCFYTVANVRHDEVIKAHFDMTNMNFLNIGLVCSCGAQNGMEARKSRSDLGNFVDFSKFQLLNG
jgi:hypothetical protein